MCVCVGGGGLIPFQNNPQNLDPSSKMDLDFLDYFQRIFADFLQSKHLVSQVKEKEF